MSVAPLDKTFGNLCPHWNTLALELKNALPSAKSLRIEDVTAAGSARAQLHAENGREARRERGRASVVPILRGPNDAVRYWASYLEEWEEIRGARPYRFHSSNLTFYLEPEPDAALVQVFRAEWPGLRELNRGELGWQSLGAAHPHWQFDALGYYMSREQRRQRLEAALALLNRPMEAVEEFGGVEHSSAAELIAEEEVDLSWTAIHFAAGARWPEQRWRGDASLPDPHTWMPVDLYNIRSWVISTVFYVREELLKTCKGGKL